MNVSVPIPGHSYDIVIERGGLNQVGDWLRTLWGDKKVAIISDNRVAKLYASIVEKSLEKAGFQVVRFEFLQGEASKNLTTVSKVYDFLATQGMTRSDGIVALGGGVVGDLAGFAASTYMRGISFVQIPTSLTAQVDSSIGGKTGVNTALAKNMVGTFAQPDGVFIDPEVLSTLGQRELIEGMGEVIKYGMIRDEKLFTLLEQHTLETVSEVMDEIVPTCIDIKRDVVEHDEFDTGERMILNFGHTLGHAVESYYHYETYTHGSAVAAGMCMMTKATCTPELYVRLCDCVKAYDLPTEVDAPVAELVPLCGNDKKRASASLRFIVCETIGKAEIRSMPFTEFAAWMGGVDA